MLLGQLGVSGRARITIRPMATNANGCKSSRTFDKIGLGHFGNSRRMCRRWRLTRSK